ncbi:SGNH/GDSL hydrolase family protein [Amphritea sp.]|uniref:SGNH/GDSL hydrolase family protein n=1 Tax=Amphritea sp. TaxID=1872502 RepID=UPI003A9566AA
MKILIYGASVVQQGVTHDGKLVGFVNNLRELFKESPGLENVLVHKRGYGSNHLNDAGLLYLEEALTEKPDIVVLDWHSTYIEEFEPDKYDYIINKLLNNNIKVVNLVLPQKSRVGEPEQRKILQARGYQKVGVGFLNFYEFVNNGRIDLDECLRDDVHTNEFGGKVYAEILFPYLQSVIRGESLEYDYGKSIEPINKYSEILITKHTVDFEVTKNTNIICKVDPKNQLFRLYATVMVGPFSPILSIDFEGGSRMVNILDQSCFYERKVLKPITPWLNSKSGTVKISLSERENDLSILKSPPVTMPEYSRLPIVGDLFCVGSDSLKVEFNVN